MDLELSNKVVVMTGATGGIGGQIALDFLAEGAVVVCLIRNKTKMENLTQLVLSQNLDANLLHAFDCNLLDYSQIKTVIAEIKNQFKTIDVLINCAGYAEEYPFGLIDDKQIEKMLDFNLKSPMFLSHAVLKPMFQQKSGCIINISSASTVKKGRGIVAYASAKAGLETFTRTLAQEVGRKKIRVNCIRPGIIETQMSKNVMFRLAAEIKTYSSLGRAGKVDEISKTALFLASEKTASYITGECITIDGGAY